MVKLVTPHKFNVIGLESSSHLTCSSFIVLGAWGCDGGGVCASNAYPVRAEDHADCERAAAAGGAGGGAGLPGAGAKPCGCWQRRPPLAMHAPGLATLFCEWNHSNGQNLKYLMYHTVADVINQYNFFFSIIYCWISDKSSEAWINCSASETNASVKKMLNFKKKMQ